MYPEVLKKKEAVKQIQAVLHRRQAQKQVEEKKTLNYKTGVLKLSDFLYNKNMENTKINLIKNINRNLNEIKEKKNY